MKRLLSEFSQMDEVDTRLKVINKKVEYRKHDWCFEGTDIIREDQSEIFKKEIEKLQENKKLVNHFIPKDFFQRGGHNPLGSTEIPCEKNPVALANFCSEYQNQCILTTNNNISEVGVTISSRKESETKTFHEKCSINPYSRIGATKSETQKSPSKNHNVSSNSISRNIKKAKKRNTKTNASQMSQRGKSPSQVRKKETMQNNEIEEEEEIDRFEDDTCNGVVSRKQDSNDKMNYIQEIIDQALRKEISRVSEKQFECYFILTEFCGGGDVIQAKFHFEGESYVHLMFVNPLLKSQLSLNVRQHGVVEDISHGTFTAYILKNVKA